MCSSDLGGSPDWVSDLLCFGVWASECCAFGAPSFLWAQTINVTVKMTPKKTMEGSSERTALRMLSDVFIVSSLGLRGVWLTEA